jgi:DNA-binding protein HU-beta
MTKKEIVDAVSASTGIPKKDTAAVIDSLLAAITDAVSKGDAVQFTGFGTFESRKREARVGKNPATGEKIDIPASTVPAFKAGKSFKEALKK